MCKIWTWNLHEIGDESVGDCEGGHSRQRNVGIIAVIHVEVDVRHGNGACRVGGRDGCLSEGLGQVDQRGVGGKNRIGWHDHWVGGIGDEVGHVDDRSPC